MHKILVAIPTCQADFKPVDMCLHKDTMLYVSGFPVSAPTNRNFCLFKAKEWEADFIIMCDDDVTGFYPGWELELVAPLIEESNCQMVSASLFTSEGEPAVMMNIPRLLNVDLQEVENKALPSACIAFNTNLGLYFDQRYTINNRGAGFEDTDFCFQINEKFPNARFFINNRVKLIHENEMKGQDKIKVFHNLFMRKWSLK